MSYHLSEYAQSLAEFGSPTALPACGGHVLVRPIPGTDRVDATGCYPLFACRDLARIGDDLGILRALGAVSLTLVTDPLSSADPSRLPAAMSLWARPYKTHHLVDLTHVGAPFGSVHHQREVRRSLRRARLAVCDEPAAHVNDWTAAYEHLVARHEVHGPGRFSAEAFRQQLSLPGVLLVRADAPDGQPLGLQLWFTDGPRAWHHLAGYFPAGYRHGVSYGLMDLALRTLQMRGVRIANLGAGAGLAQNATDGLTSYKRGWATDTAPAWLVGTVLDPTVYEELTGPTDTEFFPAYRAPGRQAITRSAEVVHVHAD